VNILKQYSRQGSKPDGGTRALGFPTGADRVAQEVARRYVEPRLEPGFHGEHEGRPGLLFALEPLLLNSVKSMPSGRSTSSWALSASHRSLERSPTASPPFGNSPVVKFFEILPR
jgi:hypothetical protein